MRADASRLERLRESEVWIAWIRLGGVVFAALEVGVFTESYPPGYATAAWATTGVFAAGSIAIFLLATRRRAEWTLPLGLAAQLFDMTVISAYAIVYSYEYGSPTRWALMFTVVEGAVRYGLAGGIGGPVALLPVFALAEWWRSSRFGPPGFLADRISFPFGIHLLTGMIVGRLVDRLDHEADRSAARAGEAERLRDELAHRVDLLDAANRCARALGSSLELEPAFGAFIRELRGLVPFERVAIVLLEEGRAEVVANAGAAVDTLFPPGSARDVAGSVLEEVLDGRTVVREDMSKTPYPEERALVEIGLRGRLVAPLLLGARPIGMLSIARARPGAFTAEEVELSSLLGRLVATAVQNIRSYEAERATVEELRRLSALRADFVSLVSHELRSPIAGVIGAARTLQARWRELAPEQRESFLALIGDETSRLAALIGDVLDTSRIEAGTFSFSFGELDLAELVEESVEAARVGQDEVEVRAAVPRPLPPVRGDAARLRQVLANLIDNAVKYSPAGGRVEVSAGADDGLVRVAVRDHGPGIAREHQQLIFEKFGRARADRKAKPGTGLGLFIARSIAEAHGGTLEVRSAPRQGATFTLSLPAG